MTAVYPQRVEERQLQQLDVVQGLLLGRGIRTLLVRHLRLTLIQNRYDPPQCAGPVLLAGGTTVSVANGYHVETPDGRSADFSEAQDAAAYVSAEARPAS
ncbi:hypothetical protein [Nonomuraea sp. NPDC046570]|uniref:hypothetical protein n=1 Tax=Nonomuraea sp. NPDC046570 TaxID=3155255 RepID=UPI0033F75EA0